MEQEDFNIREHQLTSKERDFENALRPLNFEDFSGQDKVVDNLRIFVKAARLRSEALDHVLLHGPPGLGKTTLSNIIANELGVGFKITSGPVLDKPGDLAGVLTSLEPNDVLFIDEIHRLSPVVEEYLYSAMEDYRIDIMIDKGPSARSIQIDLNPFTLVGATLREREKRMLLRLLCVNLDLNVSYLLCIERHWQSRRRSLTRECLAIRYQWDWLVPVIMNMIKIMCLRL